MVLWGPKRACSTRLPCTSIRRPRASKPRPIVAVLKAYALLSPWLWRTINPDPTRRVLGFAEPFPQHYVQRLAGEDYWPGVPELIDHYIEANPTRNRDLDLLPLLAFLAEDRVR